MKSNRSSLSLVWALIGIFVSGVALSMALTSDSRWMQWHLSRLGEGTGLPAAMFNFVLSVGAFMLVLVAIRMTDEIQYRRPQERVVTLRNVLILAAVCGLGLASFPFDRSHLIHWFFGYGQFFLLGYLMLRLKYISGAFSDRTHTLGLAGVVIVSLLMGLHHTIHVPSLLIVELVGQFVVFVWLLSMAEDQQQKQRDVVTHVSSRNNHRS